MNLLHKYKIIDDDDLSWFIFLCFTSLYEFD